MAATREAIETDIRQGTPEIVVTDGPTRAVHRPGDPFYEETIARWTEEHVAAEQAIEAAERERQAFAALLPQWERGTPEQRALAWLLRRAGRFAADEVSGELGR